MTEICSTEDFRLLAGDGGCIRPCSEMLGCGHQCPRYQHHIQETWAPAILRSLRSLLPSCALMADFVLLLCGTNKILHYYTRPLHYYTRPLHYYTRPCRFHDQHAPPLTPEDDATLTTLTTCWSAAPSPATASISHAATPATSYATRPAGNAPSYSRRRGRSPAAT